MIILDNGHGVNTPGKRSPIWGEDLQLMEYEFNRDIVKRISEQLTELDIKHLVLVPGLHDISLKERVKNANKYGRKNLFISVHANAGRGKGMEVFTSRGKTKSDLIATIFIKEFIEVFPLERVRSDYSDGDPDKEANFYVLKNTVMPAILTENFFMDNERECRDILMTEYGRGKIAEYHINGILEAKKQFPELF